MKRSRKIGYDDLRILQHEYASGNYMESADYIMSLMTKKA